MQRLFILIEIKLSKRKAELDRTLSGICCRRPKYSYTNCVIYSQPNKHCSIVEAKIEMLLPCKIWDLQCYFLRICIHYGWKKILNLSIHVRSPVSASPNFSLLSNKSSFGRAQTKGKISLFEFALEVWNNMNIFMQSNWASIQTKYKRSFRFCDDFFFEFCPAVTFLELRSYAI